MNQNNFIEYKNILLGINTFSYDWSECINKINQPNIFVHNLNIPNLKEYIEINKIDFVIPLIFSDYIAIKNIDVGEAKILHPDEFTFNLLDNKLEFVKWMCVNFPNYIPKVYYLEGKRYSDKNDKSFALEFPLISKPINSTNGIGMIVYKDAETFSKSKPFNRIIIQKFITKRNEYAAHILCENGKILNWKITIQKYPKFNIKKNNFPPNCIYDKNFPIKIFEPIIKKLNYSGGMCIDFKYSQNKKKSYIFEINPRFGGTAFTNNFINELLCVKKN